MKKTYTVGVKDSSGTMTQRGILAQDTTTPLVWQGPIPAIVVAINAALNAEGTASEALNANFGGNVDIDATV